MLFGVYAGIYGIFFSNRDSDMFDKWLESWIASVFLVDLGADSNNYWQTCNFSNVEMFSSMFAEFLRFQLIQRSQWRCVQPTDLELPTKGVQFAKNGLRKVIQKSLWASFEMIPGRSWRRKFWAWCMNGKFRRRHKHSTKNIYEQKQLIFQEIGVE